MSAKRLEHFEEGVFSALHKKALALRAAGREVYDLSVGTPDMAPPEAVMRAVSEAALCPESYRYTLRDVPEMLEYISCRTGLEMHKCEKLDEAEMEYFTELGIV